MTKQPSSSVTHRGISRFDSQSSNETSQRSRTAWERCLGCGLGAVLRLLSSTWRVNGRGMGILDEFEQSQDRHILAFWHRHYITLFRLFHQRPTIVVTNASHRGQVIAEICCRSGMRTLQVQGHGTKHMLELLERAAKDGIGIAIAVDGPLGPACEVKRVALHLAAKLECPIIPISVAARWKHVFAKRWDQLEIPHLFSRVSFVVGTPISLSTICSRTDLREMAVQLKHSIEQGTLLARQQF